MVRKERGFSILELMVVVGIIAILAAIAVPNMSSYMDSRRVVNAAEAIYSQVVYARSEAISRSSDVVVRLLPGNSNTWALGVSSVAGCDPTVAAAATANACVLSVSGTNVLKRIVGTDYENVTVSVAPAPVAGQPHTITFDPVRGTATGNGTINVSFNGNQLNIIVGPIGRARICSPVAGGKRYSAC